MKLYRFTVYMRSLLCVLALFGLSGHIFARALTSDAVASTSASSRPAPTRASIPANDDLPPVPFIIGGDDALSPTQSSLGGPLVLPEDPVEPISEIAEVKKPADPIELISPIPSEPEPVAVASVPLAPIAAKDPAVSKNDKVASPVAVSTPAAASAGDLDILPLVLPPDAPKTSEVPMLPLSPRQEVVEALSKSPAVTPVVVAAASADLPALPALPSDLASSTEKDISGAAPVASLAEAPPQIAVGADRNISEAPTRVVLPPLPGTELNVPGRQTLIVGVDGTRQIQGLEHVVGAKNELLPALHLTPAVAVVGERFPALHVDKIPLSDLLAYIKDYCPKAIRYQLPSPIYVSMDLKPKSVEEVFDYLTSHYPVDVSADENTIFVRPATAHTLAEKRSEAVRKSAAVQQSRSVASPMPATPALVMAPMPQQPYLVRPAMPTRVAYVSPAAVAAPATTSVPAPRSVEENWEQVRLKAKLYELQKVREGLLNERIKIQSAESSYQLRRSAD